MSVVTKMIKPLCVSGMRNYKKNVDYVPAYDVVKR